MPRRRFGYRCIVQIPDTTLEGLETRRQDVWGSWGRRAFLSLVALVVMAGAAGLLGVREGTAHAEEDGWSLRLTYPSVARAGEDIPFRVTVQHAEGFGDQVTLVLTGDYLDIFESQAIYPEPASQRRDADFLFLTFDAPPTGNVLMVSFDTYVQPSAQIGREATLAVWSQGQRFAAVRFTTRLFP